MKAYSLAVAATLLLVQAVPALTADGLPGATVRSESGGAAPERRARFEQWCRENAEPCRELQARREQCKANPEQCRAEIQARVQERFTKADTNGDGRISREEAEKGMPGLARYFDRIDADKDGTVTLEELQAARKALAGQRRGPGSSLQPAKPV